MNVPDGLMMTGTLCAALAIALGVGVANSSDWERPLAVAAIASVAAAFLCWLAAIWMVVQWPPAG